MVRYLALTAGELYGHPKMEEKIAYMACHFSPYGTGLSNLPKWLPENCMLTLNDRTPICGHDPALIAEELTKVIERWHCSSLPRGWAVRIHPPHSDTSPPDHWGHGPYAGSGRNPAPQHPVP